MSQDDLSPVAGHVIAKCGGVAAVAKLTGRSPVSIHKWRYEKARGGTGGLVPSEPAARLMAAARRGEVDLTPSDFFRKAE